MVTMSRVPTAIPSCCLPRATDIATEVSTAWGPTAAIGRLRPKAPTARGSSTSIPVECAWTAATVATVCQSGLSKINDCARKSSVTEHQGPYSIAEPFALVLIAN